MVVVLALLAGLLIGATLARHVVHRQITGESRRAIRQLQATLDALESVHGMTLATLQAQQDLHAARSRLDRSGG